MAIYRNIHTSFWMDAKITDEFTPEDKFFYLYLFTNPHTNLCGCYEISKKQVAWETGYSVETVERLLIRFERVHKVIVLNPETREILLINWHKYNWTSSDKLRKSLLWNIEQVKCEGFRKYLLDIFNSEDSVSIPYVYGMDTTDTDTDTVTVTDTVSDSDSAPDSVPRSAATYSPSFEKTWEVYPRKKEKAAAYKAYKARLKEFSEAQLHEAAEKYARECRILGTEERYIKHGSTFFGPSTPFTDYLAEDYRPPDAGKGNSNSFHNFDQREGVDYGAIEKALAGRLR